MRVRLLIFLLLVYKVVLAQQDPMYTQYMFNGLVINPAYAGSRDAFSASLLYRQQWTGMEGAPVTQTLALHSPLKNDRIGLGLSVINDKISIYRTLNVNGIASYSIRLNNGKLAFGLQYGLTNYRADFTNVKFIQDDEEFKNIGNVSKLFPNVGTGLYYHSEKFFLGFSVPRIINFKIKNNSTVISDPKLERHYFLTGGFIFEVSPNIKIRPSTLVKAVTGVRPQFDLNTLVFYKDIIAGGISYRTQGTIAGLVQFQVWKKFKIGYAYDYGLGGLQRLGSGSHEIMLNFEHDIGINKVITPRYF